MRDFFSKSYLTPQALGEGVVAAYQSAAKQSLTTLWQRTISLNGVPGDHWTAQQGGVIARTLDKNEGTPLPVLLDQSGQATPQTVSGIGGEPMADRVARTRQLLEAEQRHRRDKARLQEAQRERTLLEAKHDEARRPGLLKLAASIISKTFDEGLIAQQRAIMAEYAARRKRDSDELQALLKKQQDERQQLLPKNNPVMARPAGKPDAIDLVTRQELVNTHILAQATKLILKEKPLPGIQTGLLSFAALTQSLQQGNPQLGLLSAQTADWVKDDNSIGKIRADARVMAFGLSVDSALEETTRLERQFTISPDAVQQQALRVERLLQLGFASSSAQIFNPNLAAIKAAIGPRVTALVMQPQPPSGQIIPFPTAALRA
ncbi:MAG: hypothetical protein KBA75_03705 [Alphaproteobacteria bacterium]|nr:hypothetical protein [Alphaproteobacteria bacterium]